MRRRVLGVSLGPPERDFSALWSWEGGEVEIRRLGTGGDLERARRLLERHDGEVDAFGLGGVNFFLAAGGRRFPLPAGERLSRAARVTPVCDGSCIKAWWEPRALEMACRQGGLDFRGRRVLFSSALDRWALARALEEKGARLLVGDAAFALRVPVLFPGLRSFYPFAVVLTPVLRHLPLPFLYPRGRARAAGGGGREAGLLFRRVAVLAGDLHFFRGRLPARLEGAWVVGAGLDRADLDGLAGRGVALVVELEPVAGGRGLSANLAEAVVAAASGSSPASLGEEGMLRWCGRLGFRPTLYRLRDGVSAAAVAPQ